MTLPNDVDLLNPPADLEKRKIKPKRHVQSPNSFFMDVKCQGREIDGLIFVWVLSCLSRSDFQPIEQNPETKLNEVIPFEKQSDDLKKRLAKNNEAKMESSTSESEDEEYVMAVRDFKKFFKRSDHLIGECPKPPKDKNQRAFVGGSWSDSSEEDDKKAKEKSCLVAQASNEICLGVDLEPGEWIKDSRCSKHMTGNQKLFSTYKAYNVGNVIFGSNLRGNIIGKGMISNDSLKIDNVEHVDNLRFNLLTLEKICDNKCRVTFSEHDSEITKDSKVIGKCIRKKGLYVIKLGHKPKDKIYLATIDENSTLWHRRLGHANMHLIQSFSSKELVRNLPKIKFNQHFCDACKIGKHHKAKNIISTTRCLELFHMDLFGSSTVRSYERNLYTFVTVDDYSRFKIRIIEMHEFLMKWDPVKEDEE
ncbi:retrovirus-related pol polyprotein from transposon TNT 1-94 [Tanacetum coccineum]